MNIHGKANNLNPVLDRLVNNPLSIIKPVKVERDNSYVAKLQIEIKVSET
jgi:hypothetical protein